MIDPRDARIAELAAENAALKMENSELRARVTQLETLATQLMQRIEKLEEELGRNSSNSSMPPSTDRGKNPNRQPGQRPGKRRPGGQKGHRGRSRELLPPDQVNAIESHAPAKCAGCGRRASRGRLVDPLRHQVWELPKAQPIVTEHQCWALECACGHTTRAPLPPEVPRGICGPRLLATIALLTSVFRLSKRNAQRMLSELFGVNIALGTLSDAEQIVSASVETPVERARGYAERQSIAHIDETSWREQRKTAWLWVLATNLVTVFVIASDRGHRTAKSMLARFRGILVSDRLQTYRFWAISRRQVCWAHLIRTFRALAEKKEGTVANIIGEKLLTEAYALFKLWYRVRDGTLTRVQFQRAMRPMRKNILALLREGATCGVTAVQSKCRGIHEHRRALFNFARIEGVEPTNNQAERALRHAVILRKTSFGTHSEKGSRFLERMFTVTETLRQQQRDVLDFLIAAIDAHLTRSRSPSLLPTT